MAPAARGPTGIGPILEKWLGILQGPGVARWPRCGSWDHRRRL